MGALNRLKCVNLLHFLPFIAHGYCIALYCIVLSLYCIVLSLSLSLSLSL